MSWGEQGTDAAKDSEWATYTAWLAAHSIDSVPSPGNWPVCVCVCVCVCVHVCVCLYVHLLYVFCLYAYIFLFLFFFFFFFFGILVFFSSLQYLGFDLLDSHSCYHHKSLSPMHSEAKQTETREFGAEKSSLQGHARRRVALPKAPQLSEGFQQSCFKSKVREGCRSLLQTSWCWNPLFLQLST